MLLTSFTVRSLPHCVDVRGHSAVLNPNPEGKLSIIHFKTRCMLTNFGALITISETWFSCDKDTDF